jgi:hypothetical protein
MALELFDDRDHTPHDGRRLHHRLVRLNEAALMIDAQLGDPSSVAEGSSGQLLHQRLFDVELALSNIARFSAAMARLDLPAEQRSEVRLALLDIVEGDTEGARTHATNLIGLLRRSQRPGRQDDRDSLIVVHRFAGSVIAVATSMMDWMTLGELTATRAISSPQ